MPRLSRCVLLAGVVALGLATNAKSGVQPALEINWSIDGGLMNNTLPGGTDLDGDGIWNYAGFFVDSGGSGINLQYNMNADADPLLSGNIALFNVTGNTVDVFVSTLRHKVDGPSDSPMIHTIRGVGFCLKEAGP